MRTRRAARKKSGFTPTIGLLSHLVRVDSRRFATTAAPRAPLHVHQAGFAVGKTLIMGIIAPGVEVEPKAQNGINTQWPETDYCPASYFKAPKAHKGSDAPDAQTTYEGITYKFTNADVVAMFLEAPELFLPQYRAASSVKSTPSRIIPP